MNISYAQLKLLIKEIVKESASQNNSEWDVSKHSSHATQLYMLMKDFADLGGTPNPQVVISLTNAIVQVKSPVERQELGKLLQKYFPQKQPGKMNEELTEKHKAVIKKWCEEKGYRGAGVKLVDTILSKLLMGLVSADLTDSATFASGLDDIETLLEDGNYEQALRVAAETAREMVAEEGGGLMEGDEVDMANVYFDFKKFQQFKKNYNKAIQENKPSFKFEGNTILVDYAKQVIEFLGIKFKKPIREIGFPNTPLPIDDEIEINTVCPMCKKTSQINVNKDAYIKWRGGELIQRAFPNLSPPNRELLKTGICGACWDKMFAD
jgi:hypothetical protein